MASVAQAPLSKQVRSRGAVQRGYRLWVVLVGLSLSAAGCSDRQAADQRIIVQDEHALGGAFVTGDVATVDRLLADDFSGVSPKGKTYGKTDMLERMRKGPNLTSDQVGAVKVRLFGDQAVAQGSEHEVGPPPERKAADRVWTDVWLRRGGQWRIVAAEDVDPGPR